jgi:hypothetical protein
VESMRLEPSHSVLSELRRREESQGRYVAYPSVLELPYIIKNYLYDVLGLCKCVTTERWALTANPLSIRERSCIDGRPQRVGTEASMFLS